MEVKRTSLVVLLAGAVGFALGAALFGFAALSIGISCLGHVQGGIHSDWTAVVLLGAFACFGLGGVAGSKATVRLAKYWHS
ncbi:MULTISPECIES: hypothetical protein [unclassified Bradyrhizobium]